MKKTLVALAAMTAMCGASATSVTLYGVVDTGFAYNSVNTDDFAGLKGQGGDSFSMESGQRSGSRFGMKGVEDLGNGLQVGFVLENGFSTDTGADGGDMAVNASNHFHRVGIVNIGHDRIGGQQGKFAERCLQILHGFEKFQVICIHIQNDG